MKTKTIIKIAAGFAATIAAIKAVDILSNINMNSKNLSVQEAWSKLSKEDTDRYTTANEKILELESMETKIDEVVEKATNKVKEDLSFNRKKSEIERAYREHIKNIKSTLNYDESKAKFNNFVNDTVDNFKKSIDYDNKVKEINKKISEVKSDYEKSKTLYSIVGDEESDKKIKKILKEGKNDKIDRLKGEIKEMDDRISEIRRTATETATKQLGDIERKLNDALAEPKSAMDKAIRDLNDAVSDRVKEIKDGYLAENNIDELDIMLNKDAFQNTVDSIEACVSTTAENLYSNKSRARKLGEYLKFRGVKKSTVFIFSLIPAAALGWLIRAYRNKVKEVMSWM